MFPVPEVAKPAISPRQKAAALMIAGMADLLQVVFFPFFGAGILSPVEDALDLIVATLLIGICGFRWQFALAFFMETIPGLSLVPTWTAVVLMLGTEDSAHRRVAVYPGRGHRAGRWHLGRRQPVLGHRRNQGSLG